MLRLTHLLQNKAIVSDGDLTPPTSTAAEWLAEIRAARAALSDRRRRIVDVEIPNAQDANDTNALASLRTERDEIGRQLTALAEDEPHANRRVVMETHAAEFAELERERTAIIATLRERGAELEAHARVGAQLWQTYSETWNALQAWDRKRMSWTAQHGAGPEPVHLLHALGVPEGFLYRFGQIAKAADALANERARLASRSAPSPAPEPRRPDRDRDRRLGVRERVRPGQPSEPHRFDSIAQR